MASDGSIRIDIIIDGNQITAASAALAALAAAANNAGGQTDSLTQNTNRASSGIRDMAVSIGLVAVASKAFDVLKQALGGAVSRFDTLMGFPVIMEQMGFSSEQATNSINKLSDGIQGLPTTLDGIVKNTQGIAILTGDLDGATETTLALNNAFLASGSVAADAERGLTQYVQMLSKGSVDMMSWRTLQETMGYALKETATAFGLVDPNQLYDSLKSGDITFDAFNAKLIELNGGVGGFAELAKTSSAGIATSMGNLKNTVIVGVANMIISFDNLSKTVTGKSIAENLDGLKVVVKAAFKVMGTAIEGAAPVVIAFASVVQSSIPVVQALIPVIVGLVAAYATFTVVTAAAAAISLAQAAISGAQTATRALTIVTVAQTTAQMLLTGATQAEIVARLAQTSTISISTLVIGTLTGKITLATAATVLKTAATYAWGAALQFAMGPIGWITLGIGLLVTGVVALVKWFNRTTEEGAKLATQTDELASSTQTLSTAVGDSSKAFEKSQQNIETNALAYSELAVKVEELAAKENKSAEEKKALKSYVDQLNNSVSGLNLVYGKQSEALNMTSEEMVNRINLMKEEEGLIASQERLTALVKEEIDTGLQLSEVNALIAENIQLYKDGEITKKEHKTTLEGLEEQEGSLSAAHTKAGEERVRVEGLIAESSAAAATAAEENMGRQLLLFDALPKELQETVKSMKSSWDDYASAATDMFDTISTKSTVSVGKMTKNLEENQRIITKWSENIATLAKRGIDEGLLNTLREAGPESAGHVNALVKASDKELSKLSDAFSKGGDVATKALSKSLGIENTGIMAEVGHLVVNTERALADQIKDAGFEAVGAAIPEGMVKGVDGAKKDVEKSVTDMAKGTAEAAKKELKVNSPSKVFADIGEGVPEGMVVGVDKGAPKVIESMNKLFKAMLLPFANISAEFQKIGGFAAEGMNIGLNNGAPKVMATARNLANNVAVEMRKALDINSPAGATIAIGEFTGQGLAIGIESTKELVKKAVNVVSSVIKTTAKSNAAEVTKIAAEAEKKRTEIQNDYAKKRAELNRKTSQTSQSALKTHKDKKGKIVTTGEQRVHTIRANASAALLKLNDDEQKKLSKVNEKASKDMQKKEADLLKKRLDALKSYVADKKSTDQLSLESEAAIWKDAATRFKSGTKERIYAQQAYNKATDGIYKERLASIKNFIADKKSTEGLSVIEESEIWRLSIGVFKEGSKERIEAQKNYQAALKSINDDVLAINKDYQNQMKQVDDEYVKEAARVNKEYDDVFEKRFSSFMAIAGTFDAFKAEMVRTGHELMENLQSQVDGIKNWQAEFEKVSKRNIDADLLKELSDLGVKALPELVALNSMTDEQLTKYSGLYQEKARLAREQTTKELEGTRKDADNKLLELRQTADAQLSKLQTEWMLKIKNLTSTTASELSSLRQIGVDAGQGLLDGLGSMEGPLVDKAREIADAIKYEMSRALDIHSPSRWMRDYIVGNMAKGFDVGVDKNKAFLMRSADRLSTFMKPEPIVNLPGSRAMSGVNNNTSNRYEIDKSRTSHTQVTVQSEGDKQDLERMFRRMAFESGL
ncbi:tape measure protein [Sporosarcina psychrophila]|uniref:Tape measure domain-containing protein n=1 Tax=Sporosarcina psychrophila TaxID=1476 RepID=A0ABV2KE97_SPOPS